MAKTKNVASIDPQLRQLVRQVMELLGEAYTARFGAKDHKLLMSIRAEMVLLRSATEERKLKSFRSLYKKLEKLSPEQRWNIAHGYALMMEVTNLAENAFRSFKLSTWELHKNKLDGITEWVLTAHPTEARSKEILPLLREIQQDMQELIVVGKLHFPIVLKRLRTRLALLVNSRLAPEKQPKVEDEADYLFGACLEQHILDQLCQSSELAKGFRIVSWVGGDKDGHPGVDENTLLYSLRRSRKQLLSVLQIWLEDMRIHLAMNVDLDLSSLDTIFESLRALYTVEAGDSKRVEAFLDQINSFFLSLQPEALHAMWSEKIKILFTIFPRLVVPLEVRESSEVFKECLDSKNYNDFAVFRMLKSINGLAGSKDYKFYVQSLVVSMTHTGEDLSHAYQLLSEACANLWLPVVPLFETADALDTAGDILNKFRKLQPEYWRYAQERNQGYIQVMLGYSDSSKESGVLFSKFKILQAIQKLQKQVQSLGFKLSFFHGTGGAVARGGGRLEEQTSGWSQDMVARFKATYQGEVVTRTFSSAEILLSQIDRLVLLRSKKRELYKPNLALQKMALQAQKQYQELIGRQEFLQLVERATLYPYLQDLKLGSRPSKRKALNGVSDLRAIPWVMCWTQSRVLLPTWWGVGSAWQSLTAVEKKSLISKYKKGDGLWVSFVKQLAFTLAKIEMQVWQFQVETMAPEFSKEILLWKTEYEKTLKMYKQVTGNKKLLYDKPWLAESIYLRSPMIHPLNLLQMLALRTQDASLLRVTTTGIASGMLTTG